jgi:hypothetical protein
VLAVPTGLPSDEVLRLCAANLPVLTIVAPYSPQKSSPNSVQPYSLSMVP